jgi:membrane protein required for colicin V production
LIIDIIVIILVVLAIIKGFSRGLIVGVFSFIAVIIALAAALKLSAVTAEKIGESVRVSESWLPLIAFAVVFLLFLLLIRLGAKAIQKLVETIALGWLNRVGGAVFYLAIYIGVFSILLFYADQLNLLQPSTKERSLTYSIVSPVGPKAIDAMGSVIPLFRDMFTDLQDFFGKVSEK